MNRNLKNKMQFQRSKIPRSIQSIFNLMVNKGIYNPEVRWVSLGDSKYRTNYMCHCLSYAVEKHIITLQEFDNATVAIENYLESLDWCIDGSMLSALENAELPHGPSDLMAIYTNWYGRPILNVE